MLPESEKWTISYYSERVKREIKELPNGLAARYVQVTDLMKEEGPDLGMPVTKAMKDGLFEIRLKSQEGIARVFYCATVKSNIVMLHGFIKKTKRTPLRHLATARKRRKEVENA